MSDLRYPVLVTIEVPARDGRPARTFQGVVDGPLDPVLAEPMRRVVDRIADLHRRWGAGDIQLRTKRNPHTGDAGLAVPPPSERGRADVSDLLVELAEILEERHQQPWRAQAACRNRPTHIWFPSRGDNITLDAALKVCGACMVRDQCRAANLDQRDGIYGGLTGKARRDLRSAA